MPLSLPEISDPLPLRLFLLMLLEVSTSFLFEMPAPLPASGGGVAASTGLATPALTAELLNNPPIILS